MSEPTKDIATQLLDRLGLSPEQYRVVYDSLPLMARDSLDAAWQEAEAALPEGRIITGVWCDSQNMNGEEIWKASASRGQSPASTIAAGPTPAAALRALTAKLREVGR